MLPNTIKPRTQDELKQVVIIPIIPLVEPPGNPDEITFPWKTGGFNTRSGIQVFKDDFEVFQGWDPWYVGLGVFGCIGSCLLSPFVHKTQGLNHLKSEILKLEFGPARQVKLPLMKLPGPICRLYVRTKFDPHLVTAIPNEKAIKYVFWLGDSFKPGKEEVRQNLDLLVPQELQFHVEQ